MQMATLFAISLLSSMLCPALLTAQDGEGEDPRKGQEGFQWMQQGKKFFDSNRIEMRMNFKEPTNATIVFDRNVVSYDDFGDWQTTLRAYPPTICQLTRIPRQDRGNRRLFRVELPDKFAKELPEGQEMRLALSAPGDQRKFVRLLLVQKHAEGKESVEQVADFRVPQPGSKPDNPNQN